MFQIINILIAGLLAAALVMGTDTERQRIQRDWFIAVAFALSLLWPVFK